MNAKRTTADPFGARQTLATAGGGVEVFALDALQRAGLGPVDRLPRSIQVLLECCLRHAGGPRVAEEDVQSLARWPQPEGAREVPWLPARVLLQDFTGVPAVVDLAALRDAMQWLGGDPARINPQIPCDLVVDHSIQIDVAGCPDALQRNLALEFERNAERYTLLRWAAGAFDNFRVVPPGAGICHQVNLERLAEVVTTRPIDGRTVALPDSLIGTDSHTPMINGLGVVGWGVGGIEAEAAMLGQPVYMLAPDVVGVKLTGELPPGATATDLVLCVTQRLRAHGVVGKFVEYIGPGVETMSVPDRATLANMSPEYGATMGFFAVDDRTLAYLRQTARPAEQIDLVERYCKQQGLFGAADEGQTDFTEVLEFDLGTVRPSLAGPRRPQDRIPLCRMSQQWRDDLARTFDVPAEAADRQVPVEIDGRRAEMSDGAVAIASITSCTNTSNPSVMIAAGLLARKARQRGLSPRPWVKTSLAPGSRVVTDYLTRAGLDKDLDALGFQTVGYGCATCIGNSGPLAAPVAEAIRRADLVVAAVLSGNRNFEGRIHSLVKANYLASPPLVVAYALAGRVDIDLADEPLGTDADGQPVRLADLWPDDDEVRRVVAEAIDASQFREEYARAFEGDRRWNALPSPSQQTYPWDPSSTYIQSPPFFEGLSPEPPPVAPIHAARCLVMLGDSVTTDHISPAGSIPADSPAGRYLQEHDVEPAEFNSYGSRRGNDRVLTRGTFANVRLRNLLAPGTEGGVTVHLPSGEQTSIFEAAERYRREGTPLIVLAGKEYGSGSSRDWAAKGPLLLGVRAVIAASYERIHRSNLVGMGVLPLEFAAGTDRESLGLTGREVFDMPLPPSLSPGQTIAVTARPADGSGGAEIRFEVRCRLDTAVDAEYFRNGGILQTVLRDLLRQS